MKDLFKYSNNSPERVREIIISEMNKLMENHSTIEEVSIKLSEDSILDTILVNVEARVLGKQIQSSVNGSTNCSSFASMAKEISNDMESKVSIQESMI